MANMQIVGNNDWKTVSANSSVYTLVTGGISSCIATTAYSSAQHKVTLGHFYSYDDDASRKRIDEYVAHLQQEYVGEKPIISIVGGMPGTYEDEGGGTMDSAKMAAYLKEKLQAAGFAIAHQDTLQPDRILDMHINTDGKQHILSTHHEVNGKSGKHYDVSMQVRNETAPGRSLLQRLQKTPALSVHYQGWFMQAPETALRR